MGRATQNDGRLWSVELCNCSVSMQHHWCQMNHHRRLVDLQCYHDVSLVELDWVLLYRCLDITSQYLPFGSHFKSDGSILTKLCIGQLHSEGQYICQFEKDPINISGTSLYIPIVNLGQTITVVEFSGSFCKYLFQFITQHALGQHELPLC